MYSIQTNNLMDMNSSDKHSTTKYMYSQPGGKSTLSFVGFHSKAAAACYYSTYTTHNRSPTRDPSPFIYKLLSSSGDLPEISPHDGTVSWRFVHVEYR